MLDNSQILLIIVCRTLVSIFLKWAWNNIWFLTAMKEPILVQFGQQVRKSRLKQGLSQEELAEKAGVHRTYIGMIERAEKNITLLNIEKLAKALNMSIIDLLKINDE